MNKSKQAMSMLEVMIAVLLFGAVMAAVLETLISSSHYVEFDESKNDIQNETIQFQNRLTNDFANAAWFYLYDTATDNAYIDDKTKLRVPLFPLVSSDRSSIEFIKLRSSVHVDASPKNENYAFLNFADPQSKPTEFSQYLDASPTAVMIMNPDYIADPQWFVAAVWESDKVGLTFDENQNPELLRHYLYVVEPNQKGSKSLVRKYINGYPGDVPPDPANWTYEETLFDDVASATFATWLEDPNLNENQIRITIDVERSSAGVKAATGLTLKQRIDYTASMRSIYQSN